MAKIADFNGSTNNTYITPNIEVYLDSQSIANNTSTVRIRFYLKKDSTYANRTYGSFSGYLSINGSSASVSEYVELYGNSWVYVDEYTLVVPHSDDGSKKVSVSVSGGIGGTSYTSTSCSSTVTLPTIARASTATVPSSAVMGSAVSITVNRASASFTHDVKWSFGGLSGTLATKSSSLSFSWTPNTASLAAAIPNAASGTATIKVTTYSGSTVIGTKSAAFKLSVPSSVVPTIGTVTVSEAVSGIAAQFGAFVQSKSKIRAAITASGVYGSTIKSYSSTFDGVSHSGASWTSGYVSGSGTFAIKTTVTDSRGRTATKTTNVTVLAYSKPKISTFKAWRVDSAHGTDVGGNYAAVKYAYSVTSLNGHNTASMTVKARQAGASSYNLTLLSGSSLSANTTAYPSNTLSPDSRWDMRITVTDWFGESTSASLTLPTAAVIVDFKADGAGMAIGKVAESTGLEVNWPTAFRKAVSLDSPLGLSSGGTGSATSLAGAPANAIIRKVSGGDYLYYTPTGNGALYATQENGYLYFGTLPIAQGGTGKTTADAAAKAFEYCKQLWSGALWPNEEEHALSESVSAQPHGIVLVFCRYDSAQGVSLDYAWNCFFVPKTVVANFSGKGHAFTMNNGELDFVCSKYIYLYDSKFAGYANNFVDGYVSDAGIRNSPRLFVLRYIYGV